MLSQHKRISFQSQQGVVIIVALFVVALVATMAYLMMSRLERDTRRTSLILRDTQANFYAQGSIAWAVDQLRTNLEKKRPDRLVDMTPIKSPVNSVNGYSISSTIYDAQARFNINNLTDKKFINDFKKLILIVDPKINNEQALLIAKNTSDWVMPMSGASSRQTAYRVAHRAMLTVSELRLVKGVTPGLYNALMPYVVALPGAEPINVQSAPAPVLALLGQTLTLAQAQEITHLRQQTPFISDKKFLDLKVVKDAHATSSPITVISAFFFVKTIVKIEKQQLVLYTLLQRTIKDSKPVITVVWQSKGAK